MSSMSRLSVSLGVVFGCFLLGIIAEIYYVFWWRRRLNSAQEQQEEEQDDHGYVCRSPSRELLYLFCWKKQGSLSSRALNTNTPSEAADRRITNSDGDGDVHVVFPTSPDSSPEFVTKFLAEGMDSELMRIHGLLGPPRILFTIKEETKEDMESEDGKSRKSRRGSHSRSISDIFSQMGSETGCDRFIGSPDDSALFMTPSSSPSFLTPFTTPPLTPSLHSPHSNNFHSNPAAAPGYLKPDDNLSQVGAANIAVEMDNCGPPSNSPVLAGDENASFITIFVNDDSYKLKS